MRVNWFRWTMVVVMAATMMGCSPSPAPIVPTVSSSATSALPANAVPQQKVTVPDAATLVNGSKQIGNYTVWLVSSPNPPVRGNNTLQAVVADAEGNAINDATVSFDLNMTNMNMGRNLVAATRQGAGHYSSAVFFSMGGPWRAIVAIQRVGQPTANGTFNFSINR
jgi:hypothetical protein